MKKLAKKIQDREAIVGILGLGYVGLPLAVEFAKRGFSVRGFDVDAKRVRILNRGKSHIPDVPAAAMARAVKQGRFKASDRFSGIKHCDAIVICVPTPLRKTKEPDLSFIIGACKSVAAHGRKGQLVVLESTTYPGTTREVVPPLFEREGLRAGVDFHLAFSPERVDPGNKTYGVSNTPKVVGGLTPACGELASALYAQIVDRVIPVSTTDSAEMVKLLENTFRAVNIGLVNEMALMCDRLGVDVWEIIQAASTKPFGFMPFYPGPGLGGHCIPVDPNYLAWKMKSMNFEPRFIDLAATINGQMPEYFVARVSSLLNERRRSLSGSRILVLGVAYKPGVNDTRESPSLDVIKLLLDGGAKVSYHDPYVPAVSVEGKKLRSTGLTAAALKRADLVAILTAHRSIDYRRVLRESKLVFDARNATEGIVRKNLKRL